jgi:ELL-associated factor
MKSGSKRSSDSLTEPPKIAVTSPVAKNEVEEHQDISIDDLFGSKTPEDDNNAEGKNVGFDINVPHTDDEIADVDDSGDEVDKGPNAAEALRAQVNAEEGRDEQTSTSSSSSGSGSSESGSGSGSSSSSDSEGSDEDSVNSI